MSGYEYWGGFHLWWVFPLIMMVFCFIFMRGCSRRWRWYGPIHDLGRSTGHGPGESAMDILDKRYARGEIDQPEYEERKNTLESRD